MRLLNDIKNYHNLTSDRKIYLTAFLIALSGVLSVIDSMIPKPIPVAKLGIANMVSMVLILEDRFLLALLVAVFRTAVSSLMIGTFLSYTFLLSLSGAAGSVLMMGFFHLLFKKHTSEIGLSVIGAFFNTIFQGVIVVLFFGLDRGTALLISALSLFSTVNGVLTGLIVKWFYKKTSVSDKAQNTLNIGTFDAAAPPKNL